MSAIFGRRKPIAAILAECEAAAAEEHGLKRAMGLWSITALGIGAIIGTGIFVLTGHAAAESAGPGVVLSFVIAGLVSALAALCYAELASTVPVAGSAYTYVYATLGELLAWIVGWGLILEYSLGAATVAIGWSGYFADFFKAAGSPLPFALTHSLFERVDGHWAGGIVNLPASLVILAVSALLVRGVAESATVNKIVVVLKLLVVAFFIVVGSMHVNPANWHPFLPFGWGGVLTGASLVFFAYVGFDAVSTSAEELKDPARDLPRGIFMSLGICTVLYIVVSAILTGVLPYARLDVPSPVSYSLIAIGLNWAGALVAVGAIAGLTTVLIVLLYGQSRIFFAMSRDGLLPRVFSHVHPKLRTPYLSSILVGVVVAVISGLADLDIVAKLVNIGTLVAFTLVSIGIIMLRRNEPALKRGFRVPGAPLVPLLAAAGSLGLIASLPHKTIGYYLIWLVIGLVVYAIAGRRGSNLASSVKSAKR